MAIHPKTRAEWQEALDKLPATPDNIPAFFFAHGSPLLEFPETYVNERFGPMIEKAGPKGPLATFLGDFGPALLQKYKPKGIVVLSAHWETADERLVSDYGDENPLLMDYYGFMPELYKLVFKSRGDSALTKRVIELFHSAGQKARASPLTESRGRDGRGFEGPGLDHGVFVPFRRMFGESFLDVPIVEVSIDESLSPEKNWALGKAVAQLRNEGILILSGGLTIHNLRDFASASESTAKPSVKAFDRAILDAVSVDDEKLRKTALLNLTQHQGFRAAHPREEHFVPLYVAAGAGEGGRAEILSAVYGAPTFAFGL